MTNTRPIHPVERQNFSTLIDAIQSDRACLLSCYDSLLEQPAILVCAINFTPDVNEPYEFIPLAYLCDGNPYERFLPPDAYRATLRETS